MEKNKDNATNDLVKIERIRSIKRKNFSVAVLKNKSHLQPIFKNTLTEAKLDSLRFDINRRDFTAKKAENREIIQLTVAHLIAKERGVNYKNFEQLVMAGVAMAHNESGFDEKAKAKRSSATGLFQPLNATFIEDVYNDKDNYAVLMKMERRELDNIVKLIKKDKTIEYDVKDSKLEKKILEKRKDPYVNAYFGAKYMLDNLKYAEKQLGRELKVSEYGYIYQIHHFGKTGWDSMRKKANQKVPNNSKEARANKWMKGLTWGQALDKTSKMYMSKYNIEVRAQKAHFEDMAKMKDTDVFDVNNVLARDDMFACNR